MPNNDIEFIPRNTWGFIELGKCESCSDYRHLYANSMVFNFIGCGKCVVYKIKIGVNMLLGLSETSEDAGVMIRDMTAEMYDMNNSRERICRPEKSEDTCASCYHPFGESQYRKIPALDAEGNTIQAHAICTMSCDRCSLGYAKWSNRSSADGLLSVTFSRYLGENCCLNCQNEIMIEHAGELFFHCDSCSSYEFRSDSRDYAGTTYCNRCYDNNVYECSECNSEYWDGDDHDCSEDLSSLVHSYSYRPRPHFFGEGSYHLGFELEVESSDNKKSGAQFIFDRLGSHAYLKEDGSLDDGFEIVTHPHTLSEYQSNFDWAAIHSLRNKGFTSWNSSSCGLHVHVSRTAFGKVKRTTDVIKAQAHELRFIKLIYDNERQITRLAGRESSYAKFRDKKNLVARVKYGTQDDRYEAVNSQNSETLEVRVFKGSLKPARVLSALELVHASVEYTRDLKITGNNNALKWINFVRFVADNTKSYPNLVNAIQSTFDNDQAPNDDDNN